MAERILKKVIAKAKQSGVRVIYTEAHDERVLRAAYSIFKQQIALPILVGNLKETQKKLRALSIPTSFCTIIDPATSAETKRYGEVLYRLRKQKGLSKIQAQTLIRQPNYFGTMMVREGAAECLISGAAYTTAETLRPALQIIKTQPGVSLASSFFIMVLNESVYFFADCGFNRNPSAEELSEIALSTAASARKFGLIPRVALLSYSTKESGFGESPDRVRKATQLVKRKNPSLIVDGEIQLDAAIVSEVARLKCPRSPLKGRANVLIFPNLDSGNIGYKLVERLARATALGPIVQGLQKPLNVLSRGCSVSDIESITAITVMQVLEQKPIQRHFKSERHLLES